MTASDFVSSAQCSTVQFRETFTLVRFMGWGLLEAFLGLLAWPFVRRTEQPKVYYCDTEMNKHIHSSCPALQSFTPCPWAAGPYAQTVFAHAMVPKRSPHHPELVKMPDGVEVIIDWVDTPDMPDDAPIVVALHGIGGDSNALRPVMMVEAGLKKGWRGVIYVRRGHGTSSLLPTSLLDDLEPSQVKEATKAAEDTVDVAVDAISVAIDQQLPSSRNGTNPLPPNQGQAASLKPNDSSAPTASIMHKSSSTADIIKQTKKAFPMHADSEDFAHLMRHIQKKYPKAPKMAVGFSMGSNVLVKYIGEYADENPFVAAVSVGNGYDIIEGTRLLLESSKLCEALMVVPLKRMLRAKLKEVQAICEAHELDLNFQELLACRTLASFEYRLMVPIYGLNTLQEYYQKNNCRPHMKDIRVPLLCVSSRDDPIIHRDLLAYGIQAAEENPNIFLVVTEQGGHLGYLQGWSGKSWMMDVTLEFMDTVLKRRMEGAVAAATADEKEGAAAAAGKIADPEQIMHKLEKTSGASHAEPVAEDVGQLGGSAIRDGLANGQGQHPAQQNDGVDENVNELVHEIDARVSQDKGPKGAEMLLRQEAVLDQEEPEQDVQSATAK